VLDAFGKYDCDQLSYPRIKGHPTKIREVRCGKKAKWKMWTGFCFLHFCDGHIDKTTSKPAFGSVVEKI
jgi:hypothetical protein